MFEVAHIFDDGRGYERFMGRWSEAVGTVFLGWLASAAGSRWLDVGCGTGILTELILDRCFPSSVFAIDPAEPQIDYANRRAVGRRAGFQVADAHRIPFRDAAFDVVVSGLAINFMLDRPRALSEMRRVGRSNGIVAGYVWDFSGEMSPSWPVRAGMRQVCGDVPAAPGAEDTRVGALRDLFMRGGLRELEITSIEVALPFANFNEFWEAQTASHLPLSNRIAALPRNQHARLIDAVKTVLPLRPDGSFRYSARANAIKARVP